MGQIRDSIIPDFQSEPASNRRQDSARLRMRLTELESVNAEGM